MTNTSRITELTLKYTLQEISPAELEELNGFLDAGPGRREDFEARILEENALEGTAIFAEAAKARSANWAKLGWEADHARLPARKMQPWIWVAAASVILLLVAGELLLKHKDSPPAKTQALLVNDRAPGGNRAVLTLDNGQHILLDSAATGLLATQTSSRVEKTADGQVAYTADGSATAAGINTLTTPAGGQYQLVLSDGTRVWLNNASSLRFPSVFTGAQRDVELTGEAYFEVAKNASKPFTVHKDKLSVRVLGTHFNMRAYDDEPLQSTTLLEGSVEVVDATQKALLKPGDRAGTADGRPLRIEHSIDVEDVISWKNGYFHFEGEDLPGVMIQLARWYDVSVEYRGHFGPRKYKGKIERDLPLSKVLQGLESADVHFTIEDKKIIVTP